MDDRAEKRWTRALAAVGLALVNGERLAVNCNGCGLGWAVNSRTRGRLPRRWWKCRNACNADVARLRLPARR